MHRYYIRSVFVETIDIRTYLVNRLRHPCRGFIFCAGNKRSRHLLYWIKNNKIRPITFQPIHGILTVIPLKGPARGTQPLKLPFQSWAKKMTHFYRHFKQCNFSPKKKFWVYPVPLKGSSKNKGSNYFCLHYSHPGPASNYVLHFEEASPDMFYTLRHLCLQIFLLRHVQVSCNIPLCRVALLWNAVILIFFPRFIRPLPQPRHLSSINI
jgi:hypothetical protein